MSRFPDDRQCPVSAIVGRAHRVDRVDTTGRFVRRPTGSFYFATGTCRTYEHTHTHTHTHTYTLRYQQIYPSRSSASAIGLGPDLRNILRLSYERLSYDNAKVTIDLRRTSNYIGYQTSYEERKAFLWYNLVAKL